MIAYQLDYYMNTTGFMLVKLIGKGNVPISRIMMVL